MGESVGYTNQNGGFGFAMIVVLFILLIIVGAGFMGYGC
ncbi:YjcZ family sporulation protein [Sporosarcina sp. PTS2304]|nr:YjcZ family sporulation protein [Sporosarcina sp. PTS2304]AXH98473.1 YjcZ family sporulation protein [Sporosarcina sp. PTS2304]